MLDVIELKIAGIGIALEIAGAEMAMRIRKRYADFIIEAGQEKVAELRESPPTT